MSIDTLKERFHISQRHPAQEPDPRIRTKYKQLQNENFYQNHSENQSQAGCCIKAAKIFKSISFKMNCFYSTKSKAL